MTDSANDPFDGDTPPRDDMTSDDAYARGASATDEPSDGDREVEGAASDRGGELQRALDEQRDRYLRLAAEFENFRRRTTKERIEAGSRAQAELSKQLLDVLDDLSRFAQIDPATTEAAALTQGVDLVDKKLRKALSTAGLEMVNPLDQPFDPAVHEAIATEPALSPEDDHMVARVYQPGYLFNGQLLRPARVVVKQWNG